ncbi:MAG: diadenylate cyclase [Candidatus Aureabacteria bacterium]|nr:diadenylate cyclase [Candidatus Auribacterota bacterium]
MAKKQKQRTSHTPDIGISRLVLKKAFEIGTDIKAKALFIYADVCPDVDLMDEAKEIFDIYLVAKTDQILKKAENIVGKVLLVPDIPLTRMGQIKVAMMMAVTQDLLKKGDKVVCLAGVPRFGYLDTLVVMEIGREFEMITSKSIIDFTKDIDPKVFEEIVRLAVEIANEGREGKPVGTCFIIGDSKDVIRHTRQMILNPFKGYSEKERSINNTDVKETVKEFAQLDGAFIISRDGIIETAGAFLESETVPEKLPQGWGARHYSAAAITSITKALAITVSQSTGDVRIFKGGVPIMEIEKPLAT